jgi:hypothetical protein
MLARWSSLGQTDDVSLLLCLLVAASSDAIVEGRIGEPGGAGAASAQVRLAQGERTQVVRTGADGRFRFRAFKGTAVLSVTLPQGWTAREPLTRTVNPAFRGDVIRADFTALAQRSLRGRLLVAGVPLAGAELSAGTASAVTDARGLFVFDGLPQGVLEIRVGAPPLTARVELPAGPAELSRDVSVQVPDFDSLNLTPVPQGDEVWPMADWLSGRALSAGGISRLERLAALLGLDPAFRLVMVAPRDEVARGAQAAARLQRYLTGPALVPRERLVFAIGELARPRHVTVLLTRVQEPR